MITLHERLRTVRRTADAGLSLVEVLIALIILAIVTSASLYFAIRADTSSAYQQHNQVAVTLANQAIESVIATPVRRNVGGVVSLVTGRGSTTVTDAWTAFSTEPGVSTSYATWDSTAAATATGTIPVVKSPLDVFNGTSYSTAVLIGTCYRPTNMVASGSECGLVSGYTDPKTPPPATAAVLNTVIPTLRVIVVVKWTSDDECPAGCTYQASTLLDMGSDQTWKV